MMLTALFCNATLALTSVNGPNAPYSAAFQGASPTVIIANTETLSNFCKEKERATSSTLLGQFTQWRKSRLYLRSYKRPLTGFLLDRDSRPNQEWQNHSGSHFMICECERVWHRNRASRYLGKDCLDETNALARHLSSCHVTSLDGSQVLRAIVSLYALHP